MSVNVSAVQLRDPGFVGVVERTLAAMSGTGLVLEITERQGIADDTVVLETMRTIAALGVRFAIDDFGVGFSSIGYLRRVPAHVVKIDATLASEIDTDERACAVLAGIVTMAEALSLDVVVEGIERRDPARQGADPGARAAGPGLPAAPAHAARCAAPGRAGQPPRLGVGLVDETAPPTDAGELLAPIA